MPKHSPRSKQRRHARGNRKTGKRSFENISIENNLHSLGVYAMSPPCESTNFFHVQEFTLVRVARWLLSLQEGCAGPFLSALPARLWVQSAHSPSIVSAWYTPHQVNSQCLLLIGGGRERSTHLYFSACSLLSKCSTNWAAFTLLTIIRSKHTVLPASASRAFMAAWPQVGPV